MIAYFYFLSFTIILYRSNLILIKNTCTLHQNLQEKIKNNLKVHKKDNQLKRNS